MLTHRFIPSYLPKMLMLRGEILFLMRSLELCLCIWGQEPNLVLYLGPPDNFMYTTQALRFHLSSEKKKIFKAAND